MKQETEVFNCEKCKNEFPSRGSLKKHLRGIHEVKDLTFQILFQCETCENEFASPWNLEKHKGKNMKQETSETQIFKCEKCKNDIGSLKKHLRRFHEVIDLALEENSEISNFVNSCVHCENK